MAGLEATLGFQTAVTPIAPEEITALRAEIQEMGPDRFLAAAKDLPPIRIPTTALIEKIGRVDHGKLMLFTDATQQEADTLIPLKTLVDQGKTKDGKSFDLGKLETFFSSIDPASSTNFNNIRQLQTVLGLKAADPVPAVSKTANDVQPSEEIRQTRTEPPKEEVPAERRSEPSATTESAIRTEPRPAPQTRTEPQTAASERPAPKTETEEERKTRLAGERATQEAIATGKALWAVVQGKSPITNIAKNFGLDPTELARIILPDENSPLSLSQGSRVKVEGDQTSPLSLISAFLGNPGEPITIGKDVARTISGHLRGIMSTEDGSEYIARLAQKSISGMNDQQIADLMEQIVAGQGGNPEKVKGLSADQKKDMILSLLTAENLRTNEKIQAAVADAAAPMVFGVIVDKFMELMNQFGLGQFFGQFLGTQASPGNAPGSIFSQPANGLRP